MVHGPFPIAFPREGEDGNLSIMAYFGFVWLADFYKPVGDGTLTRAYKIEKVTLLGCIGAN